MNPQAATASTELFEQSALALAPDPQATRRARHLATARAVRAADEASLHQALGSVSWRRRGILQRLTREGAGR
jgi:hypothetical protein